MAKDEPNQAKKEPGKPKEVDAGSDFNPTTVGVIDAKFSWIEERIKHLNGMMGIIVIVLLVGFFTLGFALATILIQWWTFNANIQQDFMKSINQENQNINQLNGTIDKLNGSLQKTK